MRIIHEGENFYLAFLSANRSKTFRVDGNFSSSSRRRGGGRDSFNSFLHHCQLARVARRAIRGRENTAIHGIAARFEETGTVVKR